jgi:hypothetical protein
VIINNAGSRCDVDFWTKHLENDEKNERAELKQIRGLRADTLREALEQMQEVSRDHPRLKNFMYHADFNPREHDRLSEDQWERAFEIFEKERGIPAGQQRIVFEHEKEGRVHRHVIWLRLNLETMRASPDGLDWKIAHTASRKIANELGLQKVIGPLDREPGTPRPPRGPKAWEMYRGMITGLDPRDVTAELTMLREQSDGGKAFQAAFELRGYILAQGDRMVAGERALMIIDPAGNDHHLPRRIKGMNTTQVNEFMRHVDREALPTLDRAKAQYQERKIAGLEADRETVRREIEWQEALAKAAIEKEKIEGKFLEREHRAGRTGAARNHDQPENKTWAGREQAKPDDRKEKHWPINPPHPERKGWTDFEKAAAEASRDDRTQNLKGEAAKVWEAWRQIDHDKHSKEFDALNEKGIPFSVPTDRKAFAAALDDKGITFARATKEEADRSHRQVEFARAAGNYLPRFKEGEIVIVTEPRLEYRRDGETTEPRHRVHKLDQALAEKFVSALGATDNLRGIDATIKTSDQRAQQRAADWDAIRLERATNTRRAPRTLSGNVKDNLLRRPAAILKPVTMGLNLIGKPLEILGNLFEPPVLTPAQRKAGEIAARERQADGRDQIELSNAIAERAQERQRHEQEEAARQRERERDGGGRER